MGSLASVAICVFWTAFFSIVLMKNFLYREKDPLSSRLDQFLKPVAGDELASENLLISDRSHESPAVQRLREKLLLAGIKRRSGIEQFMFVQRLCLISPFILGIVAALLFHASLDVVILISVFSGVGMVMLPRLWLMNVIAKHRCDIRKHLPDTLDLFVVALEAGLSFDSALVRVGEEQQRVSTHISREFLYTNYEILAGKSREEALRGMARRCGIEEVDNLVRAVLQANKLGTSLVKTLRAQSDSLRKKRRQAVHAQILKAPVKLIFPLLFFIFPTLLIVILGPSLTEIFRQLNVTELTGGVR